MQVPVTQEKYDVLIKALIKDIVNNGTYSESQHGVALVKIVVYQAKLLEEANTQIRQLQSIQNQIVGVVNKLTK